MFPETWLQYHLLVLNLAWLAGFGWGLRKGWSWPRSLGLAMVAYPFARLCVGVWLSFGRIFEGGVAPPLSVAELWSKILWHAVWYLVVPAIGLLLVYERVPSLARGPPRPGLARDAGLAPARDAETDVLSGAALFFGVFVAYVGAVLLITSALGRYVTTGDDTRVFENVTFLTVLLLSLVAGITEEFLFRGVLLRALERRIGFGWANAVQGVFFGLVHSGYGNLAHVLGPLAFGLGMGFVARRLGLLAAVVLHVEVDIVALGLSNVDVPVLFLFGACVAANVYGILLLRGRPLRWLLGGEGSTRP